MSQRNYLITYIVMVALQILISNYFRLTPLITLTLLPAIILCLPDRVGTGGALLIAFVTGLAVDWLSEGVIGLNALALVPVAFVRKGVINLMFGTELSERHESFSIRKHGLGKVSFALLMVQSLFLVIYIAADGAGLRSTSFNLIRFSLSLLTGYLLSLLIVDIAAPDERK